MANVLFDQPSYYRTLELLSTKQRAFAPLPIERGFDAPEFTADEVCNLLETMRLGWPIPPLYTWRTCDFSEDRYAREYLLDGRARLAALRSALVADNGYYFDTDDCSFVHGPEEVTETMIPTRLLLNAFDLYQWTSQDRPDVNRNRAEQLSGRLRTYPFYTVPIVGGTRAQVFEAMRRVQPARR